MKKTKIFFWIVTILFSAFMLWTAWYHIMATPESVTLIHDQLGYPVHFVTLIGWAKVLGIAAILIPGIPRIKEWAYAGLFFDLFMLMYSSIAMFGFQTPMFTMIPVFLCLFLSYFLYHRIRKQTAMKTT